MIKLTEVRQQIVDDPQHWVIYLMDFVDDFRYYHDQSAIAEPFPNTIEKWDALLAATVEFLCDELGLATPNWILNILPCREPWFVAGMENLKAIALTESPLQFRVRKIFVLNNFLFRV